MGFIHEKCSNSVLSIFISATVHRAKLVCLPDHDLHSESLDFDGIKHGCNKNKFKKKTSVDDL